MAESETRKVSGATWWGLKCSSKVKSCEMLFTV